LPFFAVQVTLVVPFLTPFTTNAALPFFFAVATVFFLDLTVILNHHIFL